MKKSIIKKQNKKSKMTLDKLAMIIKGELDKKADKFDLQNIENKFNGLESEFKEMKSEFKEMKGDMLDGFDKVLGRLDKIDQDNIVHNQSHKRINETLDNYGVRIRKSESKV